MNCRRPLKLPGEIVRIPTRYPIRVEILPETLPEQLRAVESAFHRELLVEKHPEQESEAIGCKQPIRLLRLSEMELIGLCHDR
jgi:hypothetical protein